MGDNYLDELADVLENVLIVLQEKEDIELGSEYNELANLRNRLRKVNQLDYDPKTWLPDVSDSYFIIEPMNVREHTNYSTEDAKRHQLQHPGGLFKTQLDAINYLESL